MDTVISHKTYHHVGLSDLQQAMSDEFPEMSSHDINEIFIEMFIDLDKEDGARDLYYNAIVRSVPHTVGFYVNFLNGRGSYLLFEESEFYKAFDKVLMEKGGFNEGEVIYIDLDE